MYERNRVVPAMFVGGLAYCIMERLSLDDIMAPANKVY